ncbi:MAG: hypothetical protein IJZ88_07330 [Clostridia bacterium]|nr:hypothetical protein [Clostridia bacterium]
MPLLKQTPTAVKNETATAAKEDVFIVMKTDVLFIENKKQKIIASATAMTFSIVNSIFKQKKAIAESIKSQLLFMLLTASDNPKAFI